MLILKHMIEEDGKRRNIFFYNYPMAEIELKTKKTPCQRYNHHPKRYIAGRGNLRTLYLFCRSVHYMHEQTLLGIHGRFRPWVASAQLSLLLGKHEEGNSKLSRLPCVRGNGFLPTTGSRANETEKSTEATRSLAYYSNFTYYQQQLQLLAIYCRIF